MFQWISKCVVVLVCLGLGACASRTSPNVKPEKPASTEPVAQLDVPGLGPAKDALPSCQDPQLLKGPVLRWYNSTPFRQTWALYWFRTSDETQKHFFCESHLGPWARPMGPDPSAYVGPGDIRWGITAIVYRNVRSSDNTAVFAREDDISFVIDHGRELIGMCHSCFEGRK